MLDINQIHHMLDQIDTQHTFSLYLHVDNARPENQAEPPAWRIEMKNALSHAEDHFVQDADSKQWQAIVAQVTQFFETYAPAGKALALFTDGNTLYTHDLPVPLESRASYGKPLITPLLWALDEYERYLIVQVDNENARFISSYLGSANPQGDMRLELEAYDFRERTLNPTSRNSPDGKANRPAGNYRDRYDDMIDALRQRFYKDVADYVQSLMGEMGEPRVILSGNEQAAHALHKLLPSGVKQHVVGIAPAPFHDSEAQVLAELMDTAIAHERQTESALLDEVINAAKAGGRGALGRDDVVKALDEQRIETLLLPYPPRDTDLADELKLRAFRAGANIELLHGEPADKLASEGGVGARLYYTYETDTTS